MARPRGLTRPFCDRRCRINCGPNLETKPPAKPSTTFTTSVTCREDVIQLRDVAAKNCVNDEKLSKKSQNASESNRRDSVFPRAEPLLFESGDPSQHNIFSRFYTGCERFWYAFKRVDLIQILGEVFRSQEGCAV
ncbi:hypothetical protein MPTK1_2g23350 [Marchantia polymorpha subsp. ruderalis]|uniref:Uncharacterized protein n=1 Tax=Marchantia polymorpha TaxID=3197 RepID=A0A2R6VYW2_MARPO|nr:hypothetical protein MARPO_0376s0002 [Marchantia polymorpha]BBN03419.1 hypothetical protein Mp_2g23350 [Marchantia polymorpha subsp. ruderalis]|eukprot:PTQ26786.1 hypothetical protein MARPO_0376s0002 [Marchantia polymorpha]